MDARLESALRLLADVPLEVTFLEIRSLMKDAWRLVGLGDDSGDWDVDGVAAVGLGDESSAARSVRVDDICRRYG
jgi:hypothetical protein